MGWVSGILVYVVVWWLVLFCVLPWGNRALDVPEQGHATGAPANPRLKLKFAVTTGIAALIFLVIWWISEAGLINFRYR